MTRQFPGISAPFGRRPAKVSTLSSAQVHAITRTTDAPAIIPRLPTIGALGACSNP